MKEKLLNVLFLLSFEYRILNCQIVKHTQGFIFYLLISEEVSILIKILIKVRHNQSVTKIRSDYNATIKQPTLVCD